MRLSKKPADPAGDRRPHQLRRDAGDARRGDYSQCAYVIRKGGYDEVRARGIDAFRAAIVRLRRFCAIASANCATGMTSSC